MELRYLGSSNLKVSVIGLGANNFGFRVDESTSIAIIRHALDLGINFIDTADFYGRRGLSEQYIGKAIKGRRPQVIIATKFGMSMGDSPDDQGSSRRHILKAIDASLRRLDTDYVDLYQIHRPDPEVLIEETLQTLDGLVRSGKVRYIGCANFAAWQICDALWTARVKQYPSLISTQNEYNLLDRAIEQEIVPFCEANQVGVIPWGPLAGGLLSGKYVRAEAPPQDSRLGEMGLYMPTFNQASFDKIDRLTAFARERGHILPELAVAWLIAHPWLSTAIVGATRPEQVSANVKASVWQLTAAEVREIDAIVGGGAKRIRFGDAKK